MAGAVVGARLGVDAIPEAWLDRLERRDRLIELADQLVLARDVVPARVHQASGSGTVVPAASESAMNESLAAAIAQARGADPSERISYRNAIAEHGLEAIDAVAPWLADREFGHFAAQVIWKAGDLGERDAAIRVLRESLHEPSVAVKREDIEVLLRKLGDSPPKPTSPRRGPASIPAMAGTGWPGFQRQEFETTDGTFWRSRTGKDSLIPHLLRPLREIDPTFESWPIYHSPEVHLAVKDRYRDETDTYQRWRAAKLVIYAHGPTAEHPQVSPRVAAGLYIEKGDGKEPIGQVDGRWDWPEFVRLLRSEAFRARLGRLMDRHELVVGDYWENGGFYPGADGDRFEVGFEGETLVTKRGGKAVGEGWDGLVALLEDLPKDKWHNFHILRLWPAEVAIAAGVGFAHESIVPVLRDLSELYLAIVRPHHIVP